MDRLNIFVRDLAIEKHVYFSYIGEIPSGPGGLEIFNIIGCSITSCSDIIRSSNSKSGGPRPCYGISGSPLIPKILEK